MKNFPRANEHLPRLLLIEDHAELSNLTAEFLRHLGLDVHIAESASEALAVAGVFLPEIVLCDLSLPDMSGLEVARALRVNPDTRNVFFAIHTAMGEAEIRVLARHVNAAEINMIVSKPVTEETLDKLLAGLAKFRRNTAQEST